MEQMNTILNKTMDTVQNEAQKSIIKKRIEDTKIERLDKKRKEL